MLYELKSRDIGWPKIVDEKLVEYGLTSDWDEIKKKTPKQWSDEVTRAVEEHNRLKLKENCVSMTETGEKINKKTKHIYERIKDKHTRKPLAEIIGKNKQRTRTIMLARHGMLECGFNYKGTIPEKCRTCNTIDDENHRLNDCPEWQERNNFREQTKCQFDNIFSDSQSTLDEICTKIENVWELRYAYGRMRVK